MDILAAENAIVARIDDQIRSSTTTDFQAPKVKSFPDNPVTHFENINKTGEILVRLDSVSANTPEPNRTSTITQELTVNWSIYVLHRNLKAHQGVYAYIEAVKSALTGWTITDLDDATPMWMIDTNFVEEQGGVWIYEMSFQYTYEESE